MIRMIGNAISKANTCPNSTPTLKEIIESKRLSSFNGNCCKRVESQKP